MLAQSIVFGYCASSWDTWTFITVKSRKIATKMRKIMLNTTIFLLFSKLAGSYKFSHITFDGSDASATWRISSKSFKGSSGGIGLPNTV